MSLNKILEDFNKEQIKKITDNRQYPNFRAGDTIKVEMSVKNDDNSTRTQYFEGLCLYKKNKRLGSNFTLRKLAVHNVYIEKTFFQYSPMIKSIIVIKRGIVRRAKLYFIRKLSTKAGRIKEKKS